MADFLGARDRNRTGTPLSGPRILSPLRLAISPPGRVGDANGREESAVGLVRGESRA